MFFDFDLYIFLFSFMGGLLVFVSKKKHLLVTLLSLEYLVLFIYLFFIYFIMVYEGDLYVVLLFLCFSVCEGVLGLSILVTMIRCHGNDQVSNLSLFKW